MTGNKDLYALLGVSRTASADDIKKAYRRLAKKLHPDMHPGDKAIEQQFKEVSAAYTLLSDKALRARYDRGDIDGDGNERPQSMYTPRGGPEFTQGSSRGFGFDDLFSSIFSRERPRASPDQHYTLKISFQEAAQGVRKKITLKNGKTLNLSVPPGTRDQQVLRLKEQGDALPGMRPGDIHIKILVDTHPLLKPQGDDIYLDVPVSLLEAVNGGRVTIPTLTGQVSMAIPPGANGGHPLRLRGKGAANPQTHRSGDMFVTFRIVLPDPVDPHLKSLIEAWSKQHPQDPRRDFNRSI